MEMDNVTINLQEFLDGSLLPEEEAELLHRLSVSPERRNLLRSYMKQQAILNADRASIAVPYEAEQKLWASLAALPPAAAPLISSVGTTATAVATSSVFMKIASVALVSIVIGFASGYFFGNQSATTGANVQLAAPPAASNNIVSSSTVTTANSAVADIATVQTSAHRSSATRVLEPSRRFSEAPLSERIHMPVAFVSNDRDRSNTQLLPRFNAIATVPTAAALTPGASFVRDPSDRQIGRPNLGELHQPDRRAARFTDYLEFSIHEGIGKQFPNSGATSVSIPIVTNTDLSMKFMVMPSFWVGLAGGLANMTHKNLYESPDPKTSSNKVEWNYEHRNTAWFGLLAEFRQPISSHISLTLNGGIAASGLGPILSSELGMRYEASESVGALIGVRATRSTSGVQAQFDAIAKPQAGTPALSNTDPSLLTDPAMINLEISTGIYFRF